MKLLKYLTLFLLLAVPTAAYSQPTDYVIDPVKDSIAFASVDWNWHRISIGAESGYAQFRIFDAVESIAVVRYYPIWHYTNVLHCPGSKKTEVSKAGLSHRAIAAINGSYFNMKTLYPTTYVKDEGVQVGSTSQSELGRVNGAVAFRRHRHMEVVTVSDTTRYDAEFQRYKEVLASGPVLIDEGISYSYDSKWSFYVNRHPRTMIGAGYDGMIYLIVVDGRFPGQADGATIAEMVFLAEQFGLVEALNLDGGGSSTLWTEADGVLNHPFDNHVFDGLGERKVPNAILVY